MNTNEAFYEMARGVCVSHQADIANVYSVPDGSSTVHRVNIGAGKFGSPFCVPSNGVAFGIAHSSPYTRDGWVEA